MHQQAQVQALRVRAVPPEPTAKPSVRAMDARNRIRFRNALPALEQWISARTVLGTPRGSAEETPVVEDGTPDAGGEVRPAA